MGDPPTVLGDRGFRWVQGVKTPPYRVRGERLVGTGWRGWVTRKRILLGKVRDRIETRFSVMVRSLGASSGRSSVLLGPGGQGEPHLAGTQPRAQPVASQNSSFGADQDGRGGAMR